MQYNTVVSGAMKLLNALEGFDRPTRADGQIALTRRLLASCCAAAPPRIAPHIAVEELATP